MAIDRPREIALKILYEINEKGAYSNISINKYLEGHDLRDLDKAFITELVYGTSKWRLAIDWVIGQFSSVKLKKISPWILNVLRLGVYQLLYTDRIPESAACNESVTLAKKYGHGASSGFVNGVLRSIARNKDSITYPDKAKDPVQYLSIRYSHPEWMVREWVDRLGAGFTEELLASNNEIPEFTVRANTLKNTSKELVQKLLGEGMKARGGKHADEAVIIENPSSIAKTELFRNGYFQIQDESSMLVAKVLDPKPGELVIDVCSAPGGKSTHLAELMRNEGTVIARDIHEHKIKLIADAAKRLGLSIVKTDIYDATMVDEKYAGKADRVLVDAPCTGLGIIRRKPDIKWARTSSDLTEIIHLQKKILECASQYVKPGGLLVYSTCTIEPAENQDMAKSFINSNRDFVFEDISDLLPVSLKERGGEKGYIQLYPNLDGIDGFFIAKMKKRG